MYPERQKDWYCILGMRREMGLPLSGMLAEDTRDSFRVLFLGTRRQHLCSKMLRRVYVGRRKD